jgi:hypothetical protein
MSGVSVMLMCAGRHASGRGLLAFSIFFYA